MLSIAVFSECYHPMRNGVVVSVESFTRVLTDMGHQVTIFTARHPDQVDEEEGVVRFPSVTFPMRVRYPLPIPIATGEAHRLLCDAPYDIIHSHSPMLLGHFAISYHRKKHIPLVFTYHTLIEEYTHYVPLPEVFARREAILLSRQYCNAADQVIAPTQYVASRLRYYRVVKPISIIPTGIDIDLIDGVKPGNFREEYHIPQDAPLLAYAGRIAKEKNIPRVLSAFREVLRSEPDAHLLLIGGGPYDSAINSLVDEYALGHRIHMTGFMPREHLIQGLKESDIFVFASLTETQGLVIGEAMACGIPVVTVNAESSGELLTSGQEGYLVPDADGPFAEAVLTLIRDAALRKRMGQAARKRAEPLSAQHCTARLVEIYQRLVDEAPVVKPERWTPFRRFRFRY